MHDSRLLFRVLLPLRWRLCRSCAAVSAAKACPRSFGAFGTLGAEGVSSSTPRPATAGPLTCRLQGTLAV